MRPVRSENLTMGHGPACQYKRAGSVPGFFGETSPASELTYSAGSSSGGISLTSFTPSHETDVIHQRLPSNAT